MWIVLLVFFLCTSVGPLADPLVFTSHFQDHSLVQRASFHAGKSNKNSCPQSTPHRRWIPYGVIQSSPQLDLAQKCQVLHRHGLMVTDDISHPTSRVFLDPLALCPVEEKHKQDRFKLLLSS